MSITSAMFSGVSGLLANAEGMNVIGNNLANVNTVGFKYNRMLFSDMMYVDVGNGSQLGRGTQIQKIDTVMGQGAFESTEVVTDLAIQGEGFFALAAPATAAGTVSAAADAYYTRAGTFRLGAAENVASVPSGGITETASVAFTAAGAAGATITVGGLTFTATGTPTAAQLAAVFANLAAGTTAVTATTDNAPAIAAAGGGTFSGALTGYSSGPATTGTVVFTSATPFANAADLTVGGTAAPVATITQGTTTFANAGLLPLQNPLGYKVLDELGSPIFIPEIYTDPATSIPYTFQKITTVENNGILSILYADVQGNPMTAYYAGSQSTLPGGYIDTNIINALRVGYATVANPPALSKEGGNLFRPTVTSGTPTITKANGNNSKVFSNSLEQSNVDMAAQFVKMILTQRAYSANSKTITTADEMTQEVLNLKR